MRTSHRLLALACTTLIQALPAAAWSQSLTALYDRARDYDAAFRSAQRQYDANQTKAGQAFSALLPQVGAQGVVQRNRLQVYPDVGGTAANIDRIYGSRSAGLSVSQAVYRPAAVAQWKQGKKQGELAREQLLASEQDLIMRVAQAYFDVLAARDSLAVVRAQKLAVGEQLAFAQRNFEVGTSTITDTREAQARSDLVQAQEIAAQNDLQVKQLALDQLVGQPGTQPWPLVQPARLPELNADGVEDWVGYAQTEHPLVRQARIALEVAELETQKAQAGHLPTVDLTGNVAAARNLNGTATSGASAVNTNVHSGNISLTLTVPVFAGFAIQGRVQETVALEDKARADLEATQRNVAQTTRATYFGVVSGQGQVKALEAAERSSQAALDANKLGYRVGVRINIDVLNAQSQLFQTQRDLAKARYDVLVGGLRLRQANGTLRAEDLEIVNSLLTTPPPKP